jgi:hypothetical protein
VTEEHDWISTKQGYPIEDAWILVWIPVFEQFRAGRRRKDSEGTWFEFDYFSIGIDHVSHWKYITPPKEES